MKPKAYTAKYSAAFSAGDFLQDFTADFLAQVEFHKSKNWNYTIFKNLITQMKQKFDLVKVNLPALDLKVWNAFYAKVAMPLKDAEFGEELREKARKHAEWDDMMSGRFFYNNLLEGFLRSMVRPVPQESFTILGVATTATEDEIKSAYKAKVFSAHPDHGGSTEAFLQLTEAKHKCLQYLLG